MPKRLKNKSIWIDPIGVRNQAGLDLLQLSEAVEMTVESDGESRVV